MRSHEKETQATGTKTAGPINQSEPIVIELPYAPDAARTLEPAATAAVDADNEAVDERLQEPLDAVIEGAAGDALLAAAAAEEVDEEPAASAAQAATPTTPGVPEVVAVVEKSGASGALALPAVAIAAATATPSPAAMAVALLPTPHPPAPTTCLRGLDAGWQEPTSIERGFVRASPSVLLDAAFAHVVRSRSCRVPRVTTALAIAAGRLMATLLASPRPISHTSPCR
jgi:hypothetical protein